MKQFSLLSLVVLLAISCGQTKFKGGTPSSEASNPTPQVEEENTVPKPAPQAEDPYVIDEDKKQLIFGDDKVFHIGDGEYSGSTCKEKIDAYPLSGTQYYFEFEVLQPDTILNIAVNKFCGVDYGHSNFAYIVSGSGQAVTSRAVSKGQEQMTFQPVTLVPGRYAVAIVSNKNVHRNLGYMNDHDDFVVGKIVVNYSKEIKPIGVKTR